MDTAYYNPLKEPGLFAPTVRMAPLKTEKKSTLDFALWEGLKVDSAAYEQFMTLADGTAEVPTGKYELSLTWDDAARVYVDGNLVIDEWNPSRYKFDESPNRSVLLNLGGNHSFRVEHLNLRGFSVLSLKLRPAP